MSSSLKKQAIHGAFWSFAERFGQQGVQFVVSIMLARLLEPEDFGVVGMIAIFSMLAQSVIDSGFGTALIQKQDADHEDESTVFWFNLLAGVCMSAGLFAVAPGIASFYEVPLLIPVVRLFSVNLLINSFGLVQDALLRKEMLFHKRMGVVWFSVIVSGVVGIILALKGLGVWSLIWSGIAANVSRTAGLWVVHPWRPAWVFSFSSFKTLWKFGSKMLASGLLTTIFNNIYFVVIGKLYSAMDLGFYQRAKRLIILTTQSISQVVSQVNLPLMAKVQDDPARMRKIFSKILQSTMFVVMPMMVGMAVVAPHLIFVLLGEQWMPVVPYLQISCAIGVLYPFHLLNLNVIVALGRSDLHFQLEIIKRILTALSILVTCRHGVMTMLYGGAVCSVLGLVVNTFYIHRFLRYGLRRQIVSIWRIVIASGFMAVAAWSVEEAVRWPHFGTLLLQVVLGACVFVLFEWVLKDPTFVGLLREGVAAFSAWRKR